MRHKSNCINCGGSHLQRERDEKNDLMVKIFVSFSSFYAPIELSRLIFKYWIGISKEFKYGLLFWNNSSPLLGPYLWELIIIWLSYILIIYLIWSHKK